VCVPWEATEDKTDERGVSEDSSSMFAIFKILSKFELLVAPFFTHIWIKEQLF
jgi:hypothetical protein